MSHTPTPWFLGEDGDSIIRRKPVLGDRNYIIALAFGILHNDAEGDSDFPDTFRKGHRQANAAFIVRAVNAHDELVAALKAYHSLPYSAWAPVRDAALAKAEEK